MKALNVLKWIGIGIAGVAFVFLVIWGVEALWNALIPDLFHGPVLTYWQTAGLFLLSKILLTGIAPGGQQKNHKKEWKKKYESKYKDYCKEPDQPAAAEQVQ